VSRSQDGSAVVVIQGPLVLDDIEDFRTKIMNFAQRSRRFAKRRWQPRCRDQDRTLIRMRNFPTLVPMGSRCASRVQLRGWGNTSISGRAVSGWISRSLIGMMKVGHRNRGRKCVAGVLSLATRTFRHRRRLCYQSSADNYDLADCERCVQLRYRRIFAVRQRDN